jgi:hypothetical protein
MRRENLETIFVRFGGDMNFFADLDKLLRKDANY